jgi:hypothetical protein
MATGTAPSPDQQSRKDLAYTNIALLSFLGAAFVFILIRYAPAGAAPLATALIWAASCLIAGSAVGFLFGLPRVVDGEGSPEGAQPTASLDKSAAGRAAQKARPRYRQLVNKNLSEISDWLTKIVVGLGLVNLKEIPDLIGQSAQVLAVGLGQVPKCTAIQCDQYAFASALIVAFCVLGFLMGYLSTRLFLAGAFQRADDPAEILVEQVDLAIQRRVDEAPPSQNISASDVKLAERVRNFPAAQSEDSTAAALRELARRYDRLRMFSLAGQERTREMTQLLLQMRALALAGYGELGTFANSESPGERLVAVAMLQVKPDADFIPWLMRRIGLEKPFVTYAAIEALRRAASELVGEEQALLKQLLRDWLQSAKGSEFMSRSNDRVDLMRTVLSQLDINATPAPG